MYDFKNVGALNVTMQKTVQLPPVDLSFSHLRESERTKHVHRLHPYLGKFIPQLAEYFLKKHFSKGQTILDPFVGSGTTLVEANVLGMNSIGIDVSSFNCLISKVKTDEYNLEKVEREIKDILKKTSGFSRKFTDNGQTGLGDKDFVEFSTQDEYLKTWFAPRALQELFYYKSQIENYEYKNVLKIILSRSARSARLVPHYELTRAEEPIREPYYCYKHKRTCSPTVEAIKFIHRYSFDTIQRLKEFSKIRTNAAVRVFEGDSREISLPNGIDGIFTSPPYVGLIDYHAQHKYAYALFGIPENCHQEIGAKKNGQSEESREQYKKDITGVFKNVNKFLNPGAKVFIVANDKYNLFPQIAEKSGMQIVESYDRLVTKKASRERTPFPETVFYMKKT